MEYTDSIKEANNRFWDLLYNGQLLIKVMLIALCCICIYLFVYYLIKKIKRNWNSIYLMLISCFILFWSICSFIILFIESQQIVSFLTTLRDIGIVPIPLFLCLHIRKQVSIKDEQIIPSIFLFTLSAFLVMMILRDLLLKNLFVFLPRLNSVIYYQFIFYMYAFFALVRCYMLCFNVLFQMPKHTRRSTRFMIVGISAIALLLLLKLLWNNQISIFIQRFDVENTLISNFDLMSILVPLGAPTAFIVMLYSMYYALNSIPASEVIVTSRELVVGGLTTAILILNNKNEILDWNSKDWDSTYPLPKPLFREPLDEYRKRLQSNHRYRVSPHNEDIIIYEGDDYEKHFLMQFHDAGYNKKNFGHILEISEITPIYTMLRNFEDIVFYDHLTKLHNRNAYIDMVNQIVKEENMPLVIFIGDVNRLKQINDLYGHLLGDELLKIVADIIKKAQPPNSFVARVGGDEFVVLVPCGSADIAESFVQRVITMCSDIHHEIFDSPSISWGYAIMTSTSQSYNDVFSEADSIMYEYKKARHAFRSSGLVPES